MWNVMLNVHSAMTAIGLGPVGAVLRRGRGKDLRQLRGSPKAGARAEAVHPVCSGEGRCTVWPGTYAGGLRHRTGHCIAPWVLRVQVIDFHDIAAGDRGQNQRSGVLEQHPAVGCHAAGGLFITVLSFVMIMTVYGRMFRLYFYAALAPIPSGYICGRTNKQCGPQLCEKLCGRMFEGAVIAFGLYHLLRDGFRTACRGQQCIRSDGGLELCGGAFV